MQLNIIFGMSRDLERSVLGKTFWSDGRQQNLRFLNLFYFCFLISEKKPLPVRLSKYSLCFCAPMAVSKSPVAVCSVLAEEGESSNERGSFPGV